MKNNCSKLCIIAITISVMLNIFSAIGLYFWISEGYAIVRLEQPKQDQQGGEVKLSKAKTLDDVYASLY